MLRLRLKVIPVISSVVIEISAIYSRQAYNSLEALIFIGLYFVMVFEWDWKNVTLYSQNVIVKDKDLSKNMFNDSSL